MDFFQLMLPHTIKAIDSCLRCVLLVNIYHPNTHPQEPLLLRHVCINGDIFAQNSEDIIEVPTY